VVVDSVVGLPDLGVVVVDSVVGLPIWVDFLCTGFCRSLFFSLPAWWWLTA
jgi:hypothetical protein